MKPRSAAATSVLSFGLYLLGQGVVLMLAPGLLLGAFGVPIPTDAWVRVVGWCLAVLAVYYVQCARHEVRAFFGWSAWVRVAQLGFFVTLAAAGAIKPVLVVFSVVEMASGVLTLAALRRDGS